jgi:nucleolar protein 56
VPDKFLALAVRNAFPGVACETPDSSAVAASLLRGVRQYYSKLVEGLKQSDMDTISAVNGTLFSRGRVKYSAQRDDKYIIAAITSLESLDKSLNLFSMRVREWYGAHFPELFNIVRDAVPYVKLVMAIRNKSSLEDDRVADLAEIVGDDTDIAESIVRAARTSVGVQLRDEDLDKIMILADSFLHQAQTRACTAAYLENKLNVVAPNLQVILGTVLTARLIAQAGSLKELAKKPASTVQILGAEKALFRALKTKGNTPKYGILYHASYISKAGARDKGRIARYVANKCSLAARIDVFTEEPSTEYGEAFKGQIEGRLRFLSTGEKQPRNDEVLVSSGRGVGFWEAAAAAALTNPGQGLGTPRRRGRGGRLRRRDGRRRGARAQEGQEGEEEGQERQQQKGQEGQEGEAQEQVPGGGVCGRGRRGRGDG